MSDIIERLHGPDGIEAAREITHLREENARLRELLDDVFAQWDGDWPEELVARVKAAIRGSSESTAQ